MVRLLLLDNIGHRSVTGHLLTYLQSSFLYPLPKNLSSRPTSKCSIVDNYTIITINAAIYLLNLPRFLQILQTSTNINKHFWPGITFVSVRPLHITSLLLSQLKSACCTASGKNELQLIKYRENVDPCQYRSPLSPMCKYVSLPSFQDSILHKFLKNWRPGPYVCLHST